MCSDALYHIREASLGGSVGCASDWRSDGCGFDHRRVQQDSFVEIYCEEFSTVILFPQQIQEGQLSVSGKRMCTSTGYPLRGLSLSGKKCGKVN